jgi:hypothetical protein
MGLMMQVYHINKLLWKAPTVITERAIRRSNGGPDLGWDAGGVWGVEIGAALSGRVRAAPILLHCTALSGS